MLQQLVEPLAIEFVPFAWFKTQVKVGNLCDQHGLPPLLLKMDPGQIQRSGQALV
jgi:hypothetical protein